MLRERFFGSRMPVSARVVAGPSIVAERGFVNVVMKVLMGRSVEGVDVGGRAGSGAFVATVVVMSPVDTLPA